VGPRSGSTAGPGFSRRSRIVVTLGVLAVIAGAFGIGLYTRGGSQGDPFQPATAVFATVPSALLPAGAAAGDPVPLGRALSDTEIAGQDVSGGGFVTLTTWAGKPVVLVLWSSTCKDCTTSFATVVRTVAAVQKGVAFVGVATDPTATTAAAFARANGWTFPSIADPASTLTTAVGATTQPVVVVLNAAHHVAASLRAPILPEALEGAINSAATGE
jgi:peroxiredoxin